MSRKQILPRHAGYLLCLILLLLIFLGNSLVQTIPLLQIALFELLFLLLPLLLFWRGLALPFSDTFLFRKGRGKSFFLAAIFGGGLLLFADSLYGLTRELTGKSIQESWVSKLSQNPNFFFLGFVSLVLFAPVIEELLFRGFLLRATLPLGKRSALCFSTLFFALFHFDPNLSLSLLVMGGGLSLLVLKTASTPYSILAHALANSLSLTLMHFKSASYTLPLPAGLIGLAAAWLSLKLIPPYPMPGFTPLTTQERAKSYLLLTLPLLLLLLSIAATYTQNRL